MKIRIEVGNVISRIIGEIEEVGRASLYHNLSFVEPGGFFRKKHNRFAQDRKYLITEKKQEFRTGLLSRVQGLLETSGIEYEVIDKRLTAKADHFMPLGASSDMRDYQQKAIDIAIESKTGMVRVATGGGKTRIMAGIVSTLERSAVILVHRLDLLRQVLGVLESILAYRETIGRVGGGVYEPNVITVCTVQTICAALGIVTTKGDDDDDENPRGAQLHADAIKRMLDTAQVVVVDEAHHAPARTISEVMKRIPNATWRIGMSATDWRDDGADLLIEAAIGPRIFDYTLSDLIDDGFLVQPTIEMVPLQFEGFCDSENWQTIYSFYYTQNEVFQQQVLRVNKEWYEAGRHILTLVTHVKHGKILERLHNEAGIPTRYIHGATSGSERERVMEDVRSGKLRHLIGTSIADEGLDMPIMDALNLAGGGKSTTKAYQRIGRIMRPYPGKTDALVMDYRCREEKQLMTHAGRRANIYRKEPRFNFTEYK